MESTYSTKDLAEASFLYASRRKLIRLEKDSKSRFWFIFADRNNCQKLIDSYWQREAMINAKDFADSIRSLKSRIFQ